MRYILLSDNAASLVSGKHGKYSYLEPFYVVNGGNKSLALSESVLFDPEYAEVRGVLENFSVVDDYELLVEDVEIDKD